MFARHRQKPRFTLDMVEPPRNRRLPVRVEIVRRRRRPRFRVGPSDTALRGPLRFRVIVERRQSARRSRASAAARPAALRVRALLASTGVATRRQVAHWRQRLSPATLGQRRHMRRAALLIGTVCLVLVAVVAGLYFSPLLRSKATTPSAASGLSNLREQAQVQAQQRQSLRPFQALEPHLTAAGAKPPAVHAQAAYLFDPESGWLFYSKNADAERSMASTTKVMTLLVAAHYDLNQVVTIGPDAASLVNGANSYMGVSAGEQLTLHDLLYGLIVASGNDAAVAIADQIGGSETAFVALMNRLAVQLGLTHTTYVSPDGLDDGNHTSARDLAVLAAIVLQYGGVEQITGTRHYIIPKTATHKAFELWSGNDLLPGGSSPYPGVTGIKTGYTESALYCMAFSARVNGHLLVGATLGDPSPAARDGDVSALLDWGTAQEPA